MYPLCLRLDPPILTSLKKTEHSCTSRILAARTCFRSCSYLTCSTIPQIPTTQAVVNIHRNSLSKTRATYFQSSLIYIESVFKQHFLIMKIVFTKKEKRKEIE